MLSVSCRGTACTRFLSLVTAVIVREHEHAHHLVVVAILSCAPSYFLQFTVEEMSEENPTDQEEGKMTSQLQAVGWWNVETSQGSCRPRGVGALIDKPCDIVQLLSLSQAQLTTTQAFERLAHSKTWSTAQALSSCSRLSRLGCESIISVLNAIGEIHQQTPDRKHNEMLEKPGLRTACFLTRWISS